MFWRLVWPKTKGTKNATISNQNVKPPFPTENRDAKFWTSKSEEGERFLVVYSDGSGLVVDVLEFVHAEIDEQTRALKVNFLAPVRSNQLSGFIGKEKVYEEELSWSEEIQIDSLKIEEYRKLPISEDEISKYQAAIKRKIEQLKKR